jgi:hypothetical protein
LLVCLCFHSDGGRRPSNASIFVGGFVLGGLIVGALGCVYAPQVLLIFSLFFLSLSTKRCVLLIAWLKRILQVILQVNLVSYASV